MIKSGNDQHHVIISRSNANVFQEKYGFVGPLSYHRYIKSANRCFLGESAYERQCVK